MKTMKKILCYVGFASLLGGCVPLQTLGGDNGVSSAAGGASATNVAQKLEKCDLSLGTVALQEDSNEPWFSTFKSQYQMQSTVPLLRMMIQQSNCFIVVERGRSMANMKLERDLAKSGEIRAKGQIKKGQLVNADYTLSPTITFNQQDTSGIGAVLGSTIGSFAPSMSGMASQVGASMKSNEAATTLLLIDNRSGVQLAAAEGSAKNWDFGAVGSILGTMGGAEAKGYSNTPQGKVLVASFMDSYNQLVRATRTYRAQSVKVGLGNGGTLKVN